VSGSNGLLQNLVFCSALLDDLLDDLLWNLLKARWLHRI
jgi:hypothetical protein